MRVTLILLVLFVPALAIYLAVRSGAFHRSSDSHQPIQPTNSVPRKSRAQTEAEADTNAFYIGKGDQRVRVDYATPDPMLRSLLQSVMEGSSDPAAKGKEIYLRLCAACHQPDGEGKENVGPPLVGSEWVLTPRGDRMMRIVLNGLSGTVRVRDKDWNLAMPPLRENLNDDQIAVVLTYIRTQLGDNHAAAISPDAVSEARKENRASPETAAQLLRIEDQ
jgi:mono/diheme cytochrome c family protein